VITRKINAVVGSPEDQERLQPTAPYVRPKLSTAFEKPRRVVRVVRPTVWSRTKWKVALPDFPIPNDVTDAAFGPHAKAALKAYLPAFSLNAYGRFLQTLLWVEEEQMRWVVRVFRSIAPLTCY
jgi:helicase MOV-10